MPYRSLKQFVDDLDRNSMLVRIKEFVDPVLEISEVTDRMCKQPGGGKAILFENTGTQFPVLTNAFGSADRLALALGGKDPNHIAEGIDKLIRTVSTPKKGLLEKLSLIPQLRSIGSWMPSLRRGRGECQEVVHTTPNLDILPILKTWPYDGGRFVTLPMVITRDPNTGARNVGMYRMQVLDGVSTGMHWHIHKTGAKHFEQYRRMGVRMPIAIALGGDPAYTYSATAPLPDNIDEFILAGFLRNKRVTLVKCISNDIYVPADADIIIEGYVDPSEDLIWEGPFGDHTGFYSLPDWYPKLHVTCITHRRDAIYPATVVGIPPMEDTYLAQATERIFLSPIKHVISPEVKDMHLPQEGVSHNITLVQIEKSYAGQAQKVASSLWGAGQMMLNKFMVVVDNNLPLTNYLELARHVCANYNPATDTHFASGPLDVLDHSSERVGFGGKLMLDATSVNSSEPRERAPETSYDSDILAKRMEVLPKGVIAYSDSLLKLGVSAIAVAVDRSEPHSVRSIVEELPVILDDQLPKFVLIVDMVVALNDLAFLCWYISANADPARDVFTLGLPSRCALAIDGTSKAYEHDLFPRAWPNVVLAHPDTIATVDDRWDSFSIGPLIPSPSLKYKDLSSGSDAFAKRES